MESKVLTVLCFVLCTVQYLVLVLLVMVFEGGAAAYLVSKSQAFTSEFRFQAAATMQKIASVDGVTLSRSPSDHQPSDGGGYDRPAGGATGTEAATGFSASALDAVHAGWFGGQRCCGVNGSADWLSMPSPRSNRDGLAAPRRRSWCNPLTPVSCCTSPRHVQICPKF